MDIKKELFERYFEDCFCYDEEEVIKLAILRKRGFYVDISEEGIVSLNDFSTSTDKRDFEKYMKKDPEQIVKELFNRDSVYNQEVCFPDIYKKWIKSFGSAKMYGEKVPTLNLEPFIARLIHALALCGIFTFYSCDGWHMDTKKAREVSIGFCDRYSRLWMDTLLRNDVDLSSIGLNFVCKQNSGYITFPIKGDSERIELYIKLGKIADVVYAKRRYYMSCKDYLKKELLHKKKTPVADEILSAVFDEKFVEYYKLNLFQMHEDNIKKVTKKGIVECIKGLENKNTPEKK